MALWIRFEQGGHVAFGTLHGDLIQIHRGNLFDQPQPTEERVRLSDVRVLTPCDPSKMVCLWNNFHALAIKLEQQLPEEPLYFLKASNAFLADGETIRRPPSYSGKVVYEGELGIVIGKRSTNVGDNEAQDHIFGYCCVNDVTAADIVHKNPAFAQWTRAKSFDTFGAFGPVIATDIDPSSVHVKTTLNGEERQNYPLNDMVFPPVRLVSLLSRDMTLMPGDVIACGTSIGVGAMKEPRNMIEVAIEGIGTLKNVFEQ